MAQDVRLARIRPDARIPERATAGSFGYDVATLDRCEIGPRETKIVATGLKLAGDLPIDGADGVAMMILPRSSLGLKHGLILPNAPGLIDADYGGEIGVIVHNLRDEPVTLEAGTRIAQAIFAKLWLPPVHESEPDETRLRGGFGSTGTEGF